MIYKNINWTGRRANKGARSLCMAQCGHGRGVKEIELRNTQLQGLSMQKILPFSKDGGIKLSNSPLPIYFSLHLSMCSRLYLVSAGHKGQHGYTTWIWKKRKLRTICKLTTDVYVQQSKESAIEVHYSSEISQLSQTCWVISFRNAY